MTFVDYEKKLRAEDVTSPEFVDRVKSTYEDLVVPALKKSNYSEARKILGDMVQYIRCNCRVSQEEPLYLEGLVSLRDNLDKSTPLGFRDSIDFNIAWIA